MPPQGRLQAVTLMLCMFDNAPFIENSVLMYIVRTKLCDLYINVLLCVFDNAPFIEKCVDLHVRHD